MNISEEKKKTLISLAIAAAYGIITLILVTHHEIWSDEANVYLILKNLSLSQAIRHISEEGHPLLFYALCLPFVRLGFSMAAVQGLCHASCCAAVFLLFRFSPFPFFLNIAAVLGAGLLYFFPVMCRSYSIIPLIMFSMAVLYPKTKEKKVSAVYPAMYAALIVAAANIHLIMYAFAVCTALLFLKERIYVAIENTDSAKTVWNMPHKEKAIILLTGIGLVPPLIAAAMGLSHYDPFAVSIDKTQNAIPTLHKIIANLYDPLSANLTLREVPTDFLFIIMAFVIAALFFIILWKIGRTSLQLAAAAVVSIAFQLFIYFVSNPYIMPNRILLIPAMLLFFVWAAFYENKDTPKRVMATAMALLFAISIPGGLHAAYRDYNENFSSAKEMAEYIQNNIPDEPDTYIFTTFPANALGITYYLHGRPIYDDHKKPVIYNSPNREFNMQAELSLNDKAYIILCRQQEDLLNRFTLLYATKPSILTYETFYIVRIL